MLLKPAGSHTELKIRKWGRRSSVLFSLAALHPVDEAGEGLFVLRTPEEERRVRTHVERVFGEAEKGVVHVHRKPSGEIPLVRGGTTGILSWGQSAAKRASRVCVLEPGTRKPPEERACRSSPVSRVSPACRS